MKIQPHTNVTEHNIEVEIIKKGDSITFDEDFYTNYVSKYLMQYNGTDFERQFITYNTVAAEDRGIRQIHTDLKS
ncbi:MAG: hypothetical protein ACLS7B_06200 [Hominilimicola sp.]